MNLQSIRWAFNAGRQHCSSPAEFAVLLIVASAVDRKHRGCVMTSKQIADASVMSPNEVLIHLGALERVGLIRRGDPNLVAHYPPDRRPVVWDLTHNSDPGAEVRGRTTQKLPVAVYRFFDTDDRLLYLGATLDCDLRWANHSTNKAWWSKVARHTVTWYETWGEAHKAEREAIEGERPLYNGYTPRTRKGMWDKVPPL